MRPGTCDSGRPAIFHTAARRPVVDELRVLSTEAAPLLEAGLRDLRARPFTDWTDALESLAAVFRALSSPFRLSLVLRLADGPARVTELGESLGAPQPLVSHHLGILRLSGIVQDTKRGRCVEYRLHPGVHQPAGKPGGPESLKLDGMRLELPG